MALVAGCWRKHGRAPVPTRRGNSQGNARVVGTHAGTARQSSSSSESGAGKKQRRRRRGGRLAGTGGGSRPRGAAAGKAAAAAAADWRPRCGLGWAGRRAGRRC